MNLLIAEDDSTSLQFMVTLSDIFNKMIDCCNVNILQACDGQEAVNIANEYFIDIALIDINMPKVNGIEVISLLHKKFPSAILVVISAHSEVEKQHEALIAGAEDYIQKPVSPQLFYKRMRSYIKHIEYANKSPEFNALSPNIIASEVFNSLTHYRIKSKVDLHHFWDNTLRNSSLKEQLPDLQDVVHLFFGLGAIEIEKKLFCNIYIEEGLSDFYMSISHPNLFSENNLNKSLAKYTPSLKYALDGTILTIQLPKFSTHQFNNISSVDPLELGVQVELKVFDFLDDDTLSELCTHLRKLHSHMLIIGSGELAEDDVYELTMHLNEIASLLRRANESYAISEAINSMSEKISLYKNEFIEHSNEVSKLCSTFTNDLLLWQKKLFIEGAPSADFLDTSIVTNTQTITSFFAPSEQNDDEFVDDIFDF